MKQLVTYSFFLIFICSCEVDNSKTVNYFVGGTASTVNITYENEDGGTSQLSDVSIGWSLSFIAQPGDFVYVSAQNQGETGSVEAIIRIDGDAWKTSKSEGAFVIATSSGSVPN